MMPPTIKLLVDLLQAPPEPKWWADELDRLLGLFESLLDLPGHVSVDLRDQIARVRTEGPGSSDLDDVATELRSLLQVDADPSLHEALLRLDIVLAQLGYYAPSVRVGLSVARRLSSPPSYALEDPEALIHVRRELGEITL